MAEIAVAAVIWKISDIVANCAAEEFSRLYWMKEDVKWIQKEMESIQSFLKDADDNRPQSQRVAEWIIEVRDLAYDVEDIINTFFPKIATHQRYRLLSHLKCVGCIFCNWCTNHSFVMEVNSIKRRVENINRARETYGIAHNNDSGEAGGEEWDPRRSFTHIEEQIIVGIEKQMEKLENSLIQNEQYCVIPIVGLPGAGKTTLAKKVYNSVKKKFICRAWVYASQTPRVRNLLQEIARQVGVVKEEWEKDADVEANLSNFLSRQKYLIVIDDIWNTSTWDALKDGIPGKSTNGSALIITSRNEKVGAYIGGDHPLHEVKPLDDERSWELFSKIVKLPPHCPDEIVDSPKLLELGREILRRCGGLPLRIVIMGGLLSRKERMEHIWGGVLKKMGQLEDRTLSIVALSYSDLPSYLKPCFLYFGIFPEDHVYLASELITLWIAEGFIQPQENHTLEDVGENYLTELMSRYLLQIERRRFDGSIRSCRIHDVVHGLGVSIAREKNIFNTCEGDYSALGTRVCRLAIHHGSVCEYISKYRPPNLRALLYLNKDEEILRRKILDFQNDFGLIRVLSLEGLVFPQSFPKEVYNLIHLRYLRLRGSNLRSLPSTISNLKNLQTLDVQGFENLNLPTVIWKMQSLRHILISSTTNFRLPFASRCIRHRSQIIEEVCLPNLQSLFMLNGDFLRADCLRNFTNLRTLGICCCMKQFAKVLTDTLLIPKKLEKLQLEVWDDGPYDVNESRSYDIPGDPSIISHYRNLPTPAGPSLSFTGYQNLRNLYLEGPLVKLPEFPTSLTKLTLVRSRLQNDLMEELGKLPNLKKLQLHRSCYLGCMIVVLGASSFPQLEFLVIEPMPFLKALRVEEGVMPNLICPKINCEITLEIHSERLKNLFSEFNANLMRKNFLELEVEFALPEDDFFWEEEDDSSLEQIEVADNGKELISEAETEHEVTEIKTVISGNPLELGESSSSEVPRLGRI